MQRLIGISSLYARPLAFHPPPLQAPLPWHMDVLGVDPVQKWLRSGAPDAAKVIASREIELALMRRSNLTVVVSPDEVCVRGRGSRVGWAGNGFAGGRTPGGD